MNALRKLAVFFALWLAALLIAGIFGVVHDQISYTIAPEYFTKFKFRQFGLLDSPLPDRARISIVGFLASWWMGIPIGLLVGLVGFVHQGWRRMFKVTLAAFGLLAAFTLLFGLCGLGYGFLRTKNIELADYQGWYIPEDVVDLRRFLCVGYMHNSSYLGGVLGILVAWGFHALVWRRSRTSVNP